MDRALLNDFYQTLDPVAFTIGPFSVRWYGLGYIVGILLGGLLLLKIGKRWKIQFSVDALLTLYIAAVLGIILGARVGYIIFYGAGYYYEHPDAILGFSGMSFHGGLIGLAIAVFVCSRIFKMPFLSLADLVVCVAPIGIFLVRCANFINGELWGAPTDLPWGVVFASGGDVARHPTQLYEACLEGIVLFIVMMILSHRRKPLARGSYMGVFFLLYGIFRIGVEFIRQPDVQIGYLAGDWLTMGMVLSAPMVVIGICLLVYALKTRHPQIGLLAAADVEPDVEPGIEQEVGDSLLADAGDDLPAELDAGDDLLADAGDDLLADADGDLPDELDAGDLPAEPDVEPDVEPGTGDMQQVKEEHGK